MQKQEFVALIREIIDDPNAKQWSATNLGLLADTQQRRLWKRVHEMQPYFTSALDDALTPLTSPGVIAAPLDGSTSDLANPLLRIQTITRDNLPYHEVSPTSLVIEDGAVVSIRTGSFSRVWTRLGNDLHVFPYDTTSDIEVRYSFFPAKFSGLADATEVLWPEGHEMALVLAIASVALAKGAREDITEVAALARFELQDMLAWVSRLSVGPLTPYYHDSLIDWGADG